MLIDILKDPKKHDVLKLYAAKGLKEYFPAPAVPQEDEEGIKERVEQKVRDAKLIVALAGVPRLQMGPEDRSRGGAVHSPEAIAAPANAQVPAVHFQRKQKNILVRPCLA